MTPVLNNKKSESLKNTQIGKLTHSLFEELQETPQDKITKLEKELKNKLDIISDLSDQVNANSISQKGVETLKQLLKECQNGLVKERKRVKTYEAAIYELQLRLEEKGISGDLKVGEVTVAGPSQENMFKLVAQNHHLQQLLNKSNLDTGQLAEARTNLEERCESLRSERDVFKDQINKVNRTSSPDSDNDTEMARLHHEIYLLSSKNREKDMLIEMMNETLMRLKKDSQNICSTLDKATEHFIDHTEPQPFVEISAVANFEKENLMSQVQQLNEKNEELLRENIEVKEMNDKWQAYEQKRSEFVESLQNNIAILNEEASKNGDKIQLTAMTAKYEQSAADYSNLKASYQQLQQSSAQDMEVFSDLNKKELTILQEQVLVLQEQAKMYAEDFQQEKRDKELANRRIEQMQQEQLQENEARELTPYQRHFQTMPHVGVTQQDSAVAGQPNSFTYGGEANGPPSHSTIDELELSCLPESLRLSLADQLDTHSPFNRSNWKDLAKELHLTDGDIMIIDQHSLPKSKTLQVLDSFNRRPNATIGRLIQALDSIGRPALAAEIIRRKHEFFTTQNTPHQLNIPFQRHAAYDEVDCL